MSSRLVKRNPDNPTFLDTHGWVLFTMGDYKEAKVYLERAAKGEANGVILEHYGDVLFKLGDIDNAVTQWERAKGLDDSLELIDKKGFSYVEDGATYFRTTEFGDEKDRVLVKSDGNPTYFLGDIAYHQTKLERGFTHVLDLLGPDHHGHIPRIKAAAAVLGAQDDWLDTMGVGWVRLMEGSKPISMSKREGEFISYKTVGGKAVPAYVEVWKNGRKVSARKIE